MWGFYVPGAWETGFSNEPPRKRRCTVSAAWPVGGGPARERTRLLEEHDHGTIVMVEFDDAPGFWWDVPRDLVVF